VSGCDLMKYKTAEERMKALMKALQDNTDLIGTSSNGFNCIEYEWPKLKVKRLQPDKKTWKEDKKIPFGKKPE
jgi:hypothetical protein